MLFVVLCCFQWGYAQNKFRLPDHQKSDKIKFKLINNLIVLPVEVNGVDLSFLLDTGVAKPIVFGFFNEEDTLQIRNTEAFFLRGLGEGDAFEALKSKNNTFKIGEAVSSNQDLYAIYDSSINFTPKLGVPIHGIIGYDLFKDFVVEINYSAKYIKLFDPEYYDYKACRDCETLNLEFYNNKPYLNLEVQVDGNFIPVKLLIDSGGSDALWLFENKNLGLHANSEYFIDFLGHGLSGSVYGKRSKIDALKLKGFSFENVNVAYPDSSDVFMAKKFKDRNGSIAGNVLMRFNMIVDYRKAKLTLKRNRYFKKPFRYNMSGIELEHHGVQLVAESTMEFLRQISDNNIKIDFGSTPEYNMMVKPAFVIVELREDSPAKRVGLLVGDVVIKVNNRDASSYKLQEIMELFYGEEGEEIKMEVDRNGFESHYKFRLESPLK
ncbi:PDZ domain-containing protein [Formosa sp. S-31]